MPGNTSVFRGREQETFLARDVAGGADVRLRSDEARHTILKFTGVLTANISVRVPVSVEDSGLRWICHNATTGDFTLTIRPENGNGVSVPQGESVEVYSDGADFLSAGSASSTVFISSPVGFAAPVLQLSHQYTNADFPSLSANHPDYSALVLNHTNLADTANISSPFDLIWTGLRSAVTYGSDTVNARGTEHGVTVTVDVQGSASGSNELAGLMGWMRALAASGDDADGVAAMWFTDWSLHGNLGEQSSLLNGITMIVNSYVADSPSRGPSAAAWFVTKPNQGAGREAGHDAVRTHPLDYMVGIMGFSGTPDEVTKDRAAQIGLAIGEWGSGWAVVQDDDESWFRYGLSVRGGEDAGIRISDPHADGSSNYVGSAILFDTRISGRNWVWLWNAGVSEAPTAGAIKLHGANNTTAGRIQWGDTNAPALYRAANDTLGFVGNQQWAEAGNVVLGTTTGSQIGTVGGAAGQKLAFLGATPVVQQVLATGAGATADQVISLLQTLGLCRQS